MSTMQEEWTAASIAAMRRAALGQPDPEQDLPDILATLGLPPKAPDDLAAEDDGGDAAVSAAAPTSDAEPVTITGMMEVV